MFQTILGAFASVLDVISAIILGIGMGFSAMPTAIGFLITGIALIIFKQVAPISVPSEQLILINKFSKDRDERSSMILYAAVIVLTLGVTGLLGYAVDYVGETILSAVMVGVGIMIFFIAVNMVKENLIASIVSLVLAYGTYFLTQNLIYTATISILCAATVYNIVKRKEIKDRPKTDLKKENFKFIKPKFNSTVVRGTLALFTLSLGGIISDGSISCELAGQEPNQNIMAGYVGLSNVFSGLFGGMPTGTIVSGTATAPNPILSAVIMMFVIVVLLLLKVIPKIAHLIPSQSLCGFLAVLATIIIIPDNALTALQGHPIVASITMLVTAFVDPFMGMLAGVITRLITTLVGM